ncbi:MAG: hypothetical protein SFU86_03895 [Pirellulaceae bacterium]|nr:hypothetical protein [Pirellulaceae bacterium]
MVARLLDLLPPSERDFEVFYAVVVEGESPQAASERFGLSPARVAQIRQSVSDWLARSAPQARPVPAAQRTELAAEIAEKRLDHLYAEALAAWRKSPGAGDVRYLALAARIAERGARLARQTEGGRANTAPVPRDEDDGESPDDGRVVSRRQVTPLAPPPSELAEYADDASLLLSAQIERRRAAFLAALANENSPVQPPRTDANGMLLEEDEQANPPRERSTRRGGLRRPEPALLP